MNAKGGWKLGVSTPSLIVVIGVCLLLLAPAILQYQWVQRRQVEKTATERQARLAAIRAEAEAQRARLEKQVNRVKKDDRVRQLYEEIDNLMRMGDHVREWSADTEARPSKVDLLRK